jgi:alpha-methylacyl-CoA racemase
MKSPDGVTIVRDLVAGADALMEGFRPGVMERLGLGPEPLLRINPSLVYGRVTGWGQDGPNALSAGHDINYIALAGALHGYGRAGGKPTPPINIVGDFGGGGMLLSFAILAGILSARATGQGQVIDCAMTDGAALLSSMIWGLRAQDMWRDERGVNLLDTGAHFYETYETQDGKFVALGAIEPKFYAVFRQYAGLAEDPAFEPQFDARAWPELKDKLAAVFRRRTRAEWCDLLEGTDACFAPVLSMAEAPLHAHNQARGTFQNIGAVMQPAPAPRFSLTAPQRPRPATTPGADTRAVLAALGYDQARIDRLIATGTAA